MAFSEDGLSAIATKLADVELKDNTMVAMPKITGDGHYTCNIHVEYVWKPPRPVPKKPNASSSGNKNKGMEPTIEISNSNPFKVLNSIDNNVELGTSGGLQIWKFKDLLSSGQAILVDDAGNPLRKVEFLGDYDSEDEVASVDTDMTRSLTSERVGFGTQSLLEQWRDSYGNIDYYEDPYDDDMYKGQDFLMRFKLYAIIWISEFEVVRRNKFLFLLSSNFVYLPLRK
ncbi:hypothetical protein Tco_0070747 [Tanacetum coccineum]